MNTDKEKLYQEIIKLYDEYRWSTSILAQQQILEEIIKMKEVLALYDRGKKQ